MKREEIIKEEYAWQVEEDIGKPFGIKGQWLLIADTDTLHISNAELMRLYAEWKKEGRNIRLLRWSKIVKYEVMDGEGF